MNICVFISDVEIIWNVVKLENLEARNQKYERTWGT